MSAILPPKKDVALALLERASVFVHLDPREDDVVVPAWLKKQPQLVLQIGLNMAVKIPDLEVAEEAVSCTLSFSRRPHFCYVPWGAVYALVGEDGRGMVWPEDIPPEVAAQSQTPKNAGLHSVHSGQTSPGDSGESFRSSERPSQRPSLVAIDGEKKDGERDLAAALQPAPVITEDVETPAQPQSKRRPSERPYLRLVK